MRRRSGIINTVMKLPKRVYLAAAVLLFMGGAGTALALQPEKVKEPVTVQQVASVTPQQEEIVAQEPTEPVVEEEQPVVEPEPEPESTKDRIKREVEAVAVSIGLDDEAKWGKDKVSAQSYCIDRRITESTGYDNDSGWRTLLDTYMNGKQSENGTTRLYFDGYSCFAKYFVVPN